VEEIKRCELMARNGRAVGLIARGVLAIRQSPINARWKVEIFLFCFVLIA
jgi:hypothetical protein